MTAYRKQRGRRSLAAILAAMLMASVLAVVKSGHKLGTATDSEGTFPNCYKTLPVNGLPFHKKSFRGARNGRLG